MRMDVREMYVCLQLLSRGALFHLSGLFIQKKGIENPVIQDVASNP